MKGGFKSSGPGPSRRYCLVKWLSGRDVGSFTPNLDLEWVKNFEESDDYRSESHVIEWRVPPKPQSGWPLFDGQILEISDDQDFLQLRMRQEEDAAKNPVDKRVGHIPTSTPRSRPLQEVNSGNSIGIEDVKNLLCSLISSGAKTTTTASESLVEEENLASESGRGLAPQKSIFMEAKLARSPSSMTVELVRASFSEERRRKSSYAGQARTRNGIKVQKPSLKKYRKMKDIQNLVNERFPYFSQAHFGQAVNSCLGANVDDKPQKQLIGR